MGLKEITESLDQRLFFLSGKFGPCLNLSSLPEQSRVQKARASDWSRFIRVLLQTAGKEAEYPKWVMTTLAITLLRVQRAAKRNPRHLREGLRNEFSTHLIDDAADDEERAQLTTLTTLDSQVKAAEREGHCPFP